MEKNEEEKDRIIRCERVRFMVETRRRDKQIKKELDDELDELLELVHLSRHDDEEE